MTNERRNWRRLSVSGEGRSAEKITAEKEDSFARTGGLTATATEGWAEVMYGLATGVDVDEVIEEQVDTVAMAFERFISKVAACSGAGCDVGPW